MAYLWAAPTGQFSESFNWSDPTIWKESDRTALHTAVGSTSVHLSDAGRVPQKGDSVIIGPQQGHGGTADISTSNLDLSAEAYGGNFRNLPKNETIRQLRNWKAFQGKTDRVKTKDLKLIGNPDYFVAPGGMFHKPESHAGTLVASSASINNYTDKILISSWVYPSYHGGNQMIATKGHMAYPNQFLLYRSGGYLYFRIYQHYDSTDKNKRREAYIRLTGSLPTQKWTHIAAVWNGSQISSVDDVKSNLKLYIDNVEILTDGSSDFFPYWYSYNYDSNPLTAMGGSIDGIKDPVFAVGSLASYGDGTNYPLYPFYGTIKNLSIHGDVSNYASKISSIYNNRVVLDSDDSVWASTDADHLYSFEDSSNIGLDSRGPSHLTEFDKDASYSHINIFTNHVKSCRAEVAPVSSSTAWQAHHFSHTTYNMSDDGSSGPCAIPSGEFNSPVGFYLAASGVPVMPFNSTVRGWGVNYNAETGIIQTNTSKGNVLRLSYSGFSNSYHGTSNSFDSDYTKEHSYYLKNAKFHSINTGDGFIQDPAVWTDDEDYFHFQFVRIGATINAVPSDFPYDSSVALSNSINQVGRSIKELWVNYGGNLNIADNTKLYTDGNVTLYPGTSFKMKKGEIVSTKHRGLVEVKLTAGLGQDWSFTGSETRLNTTIPQEVNIGDNFITVKAGKAESFGAGDMVCIEPKITKYPFMSNSGVSPSGENNFLGLGQHLDEPENDTEEAFLVSHVDATLDRLYVSSVARSSASVIADSNGSEVLISDIEGDLFKEGDSVVINDQIVTVSQIEKTKYIYYEYPFDSTPELDDWTFDSSSDEASATGENPFAIEWRIKQNSTGLNYLSMTGYQHFYLDGTKISTSGHSSYNSYYYDTVGIQGGGVTAGARTKAEANKGKGWEWNNSPVLQDYHTLFAGHGDLAGEPHNGLSLGTYYERQLLHKTYYESNPYIEFEVSPLSDFSTGKVLANISRLYGCGWDLPLGEYKPINNLTYTKSSKMSFTSYPGHYSDQAPKINLMTLGCNTNRIIDITGYNGKDVKDFYQPKKVSISKFNGLETVTFDGDVISQSKQKSSAGKFGLWSYGNPTATFKNVKLGVNCYKLTLNGYVLKDDPAIPKGAKILEMGRIKKYHSAESEITKVAGQVIGLENFESIASPINEINSNKNPENEPADLRLPSSTKSHPEVVRWSKKHYGTRTYGSQAYFAGNSLDPSQDVDSAYAGYNNKDDGVMIIDLKQVKNFNHISLNMGHGTQIGQVQNLRISVSNDGFNFESIRSGNWMNNHNLFQTYELSKYTTSSNRNPSMYDGDTDKRLLGSVRYYNILPSSTVSSYYSNGADNVSARFIKIEFKNIRTHTNGHANYIRNLGVYSFEFEKTGGTKIAPKFTVKLSSVSDMQVGDRIQMIQTANQENEVLAGYSDYNGSSAIWNRSTHWSVGRVDKEDFNNNLETSYEIISVDSSSNTVQLSRPLDLGNLMTPERMGQKIFVYKVNRDFKMKGMIGSGEAGKDPFSGIKFWLNLSYGYRQSSFEINFKNIEFQNALNQYSHYGIHLYHDYSFYLNKTYSPYFDSNGLKVRRDFDYGKKKVAVIVDGLSFTDNTLNTHYAISVYRPTAFHAPLIMKKNYFGRVHCNSTTSQDPTYGVGYLRYNGNIKNGFGDFIGINGEIKGNISSRYDNYGGEHSMYLPFKHLGAKQDIDDLLFLSDAPYVYNKFYSTEVGGEQNLITKTDGFLKKQGGIMLTAGKYSWQLQSRYGLDLLEPRLLQFDWIDETFLTRGTKYLLRNPATTEQIFLNQNKKCSYPWNANLNEKSKFYSDSNTFSIIEITKENRIKYHGSSYHPYSNTVSTFEKPALFAMFQGESNGGYKIRFKGSVKMLNKAILQAGDSDKPIIQTFVKRNYYPAINDHMPSIFAYGKGGRELLFQEKLVNKQTFEADKFFHFDKTIEINNSDKVFIGFAFLPFKLSTVELYGFSAAILDAKTDVFEHHNDFSSFNKNYVERLDDRLGNHTAVGTASSTLDVGSISGITIKLQQ